jgi:hypothetical protein
VFCAVLTSPRQFSSTDGLVETYDRFNRLVQTNLWIPETYNSVSLNNAEPFSAYSSRALFKLRAVAFHEAVEPWLTNRAVQL